MNFAEDGLVTTGIRVTPQNIVIAIYDTVASEVLNVENIVAPVAFDPPDALKYIRSNLLDIMREFDVRKAGIRATEPSAQTKNIDRIQIEGVILEAFASSTLDAYYIGHISSISARIGIERARFKPMVENREAPDVENWADMTKEAREAILCAKGAEYA